MKNPAEEMVTAWLQECKHLFTMNNIKVPKERGGMGAEIDILATGKGTNVWIEVSVSTSPRCNFLKRVRFASTVKEYLKDFERTDKKRKVAEYFGDRYEMWLVHGRLALTREEIHRFKPEMLRHGVRPIYFGEIFRQMRRLKGYRLDAARGYMNLFEAFHSFDSDDVYFDATARQGVTGRGDR
jgi:hypothetical protein